MNSALDYFSLSLSFLKTGGNPSETGKFPFCVIKIQIIGARNVVNNVREQIAHNTNALLPGSGLAGHLITLVSRKPQGPMDQWPEFTLTGGMTQP